jgi:hypothetical protein
MGCKRPNTFFPFPLDVDTVNEIAQNGIGQPKRKGKTPRTHMTLECMGG